MGQPPASAGLLEPETVPETRRWLEAIRRELSPRMPLGSRLVVIGPRYAEFAIRCRVEAEPGRDPATVCLVAISKTFPVDHVRAAADAGQLDFGENKLQEALVKMDATRDLPLRWHLVGHLQSNKARKAGGRFDVIHAIDDAAVAGRVDEGAAAARRTVRLLVQVDLAREPTKHGVPPELVHEILRSAGTQSAARMAGLMVLPPAVEVPESARPYFTRLRELRVLLHNGMLGLSSTPLAACWTRRDSGRSTESGGVGATDRRCIHSSLPRPTRNLGIGI